jgi:MoxR-like ATPase
MAKAKQVPTFDLTTVPEKDRARVAALIPGPAVAEAYVHRTIEGIYDFDVLDGAIEDMENVLLSGPTGSAKSTFFRAYASARQMPYAVVESNASMDLSTVLGRIHPQTFDWIDGEFTLVVRYGGLGVVEEINMTHPRIGAGFHQLLAVSRRMSLPENNETVIAGAGGLGERQPCLFGACMNPKYEGTVRMNAALLNRFGTPLKWPYLREVESELLNSSRLIDLAEGIRLLAEIRTPVPTNALMELERHYFRHGWAYAARLFVNRFDDAEAAPVMRALEANSAAIQAELAAS